MKKIINSSLSIVVMVLLSACGAQDSSTTGNTSGLSSSNMGGTDISSMSSMDGMDSYSMESGQTYDSNYNSNSNSGSNGNYSADDRNSQNDGRNSADQGKNNQGNGSDSQSQAGGLQNNMAALNSNGLSGLTNTDPTSIDTSGGGDSSGDDSSRYRIIGDMTVDIEGKKPVGLHTAADRDHIIAPPYQEMTVRGAHAVYISGYDIQEDRVNADTGSIMFKYTTQDMTTTGCYPLESPKNVDAQVCIDYVQTLDGSKRVYLEGYIQDAQICSDDNCTSTFTGSVDFKTQVLALQQD